MWIHQLEFIQIIQKYAGLHVKPALSSASALRVNIYCRVVHMHMKHFKLFTIFSPTLPFYTKSSQLKLDHTYIYK